MPQKDRKMLAKIRNRPAPHLQSVPQKKVGHWWGSVVGDLQQSPHVSGRFGKEEIGRAGDPVRGEHLFVVAADHDYAGGVR